MIKKGIFTSIGVIILFLLGIFYFITFDSQSGNKVITDSVLGVIIFHNLYVLIIYLLIAVGCFYLGIRKAKIQNPSKKKRK
jgi:hypothetical protein